RPPINCWHFDLCSQRRLRGAHRNREINVIPIAPEDGMLLSADDDVQVASRAAVNSGITLPSQPDPLPIARPRLDPHLQRFSAADRALAMASGTSRNVLPCPLAPRACYV